MQFENWLRFYFLRDEDGTLYVRVPEEAAARIEADYPEYLKLVELLNDEPIDYQKSMSTICQYVVSTFDTVKYQQGTVSRVFDSDDFQLEMHLFNVWAQAHEEELDRGFFEFAQWMEFFEEWKATPEVVEQMEKVRQKVKHVRSCTAASRTDTVQ
jgi:hypothetical protein